MTNDAIKKKAHDYADSIVNPSHEMHRSTVLSFLAGASAHAKLLSEKGVEGAIQVVAYKNLESRIELVRYNGYSSEILLIEVLPSLNKIEQLERQLELCKEHLKDIYEAALEADIDESHLANVIEQHYLSISELDRK